MTERKHIDPTIYTTRPTDERLEKENRVYDLLEELSIPFVRIDHDAMNTIDECQDVDKFLGVEICKNLFLCNSQKTKFYLLMMPGRKKFVTRDFCKQINSSRLSRISSRCRYILANVPGSNPSRDFRLFFAMI